MRDSRFLGSTALTMPAPVYSPQAVGFVVGALGGTTAAVGTAYAAGVAAGTTFAASAIGGIVINATIGIGLSVVASALQPAPEIPKPSARMVSYAQGVAYAEYALGRVRKGGPIGFTGAQGKYRWYVPILAAHAIQGVVQHYLDERVVEFDETGECITAPIGSKAYVEMLLGQPGQTASAALMAAFPGQITAAHDFKGLSGAVVRAKKADPEKFSKIYPRSREWDFTPVIDGLSEVYDPRSDSWGYTNNAALLLAWWLTEVQGREVDWDDVAIEADASDVAMTDRYGATAPKWTINGTLSDDQDYETQRAQLCGACDAFLYEKASGEVGFYVGRWIAPEVTLADDDFEVIEIASGQTGSDAVTEIVPEYIEPENAWREWSAGAWVVDPDGNQTHRDTPQLFMVNWHNQACRIAKRIGATKAAEFQLKATIGPIGYELIGKRFFRVIHAEQGIDEVFEIGKLVLEQTGVFTLTANSVKESDFDFDSAIEEPERPEVNAAEIEDASETDAVTGVTAAAMGFGRVRVTWDEQDAIYTQKLRFTRDSDGEVFLYDASGRTYAEISGLTPGETYSVEVANARTSVLSLFAPEVAFEGEIGPWAPDPPATVAVIGDIPASPLGLTSAAEPGRAVFAGTAGYFTIGVAIYRADTDDFGAAVPVGDMIPVSMLAPFVVSVGDASAVNLVSNGEFAADVDWTKGTGWTISGGSAEHAAGTGSDLEQPVTMTPGSDYRLSYTLTASAGSLRGVLAGSSEQLGALRTADGTYQETLTAPAGAADLALRASSDFAGTVDAVSLVAVTAETVSTGYFWLVPVGSDGSEGSPSASQYLIIP